MGLGPAQTTTMDGSPERPADPTNAMIARQLARLVELTEYALRLQTEGRPVVKAARRDTPGEEGADVGGPEDLGGEVATGAAGVHEEDLDVADTDPPYIYALDSPSSFGLSPPIEITRPLIFVPGIMGSKLWRPMIGDADLLIWPMISFSSHAGFSQLTQNHRLKAQGLFPLAYDELLNFLYSIGFKLNINFWVFAYDWTQSNLYSGQQLGGFIQAILGEHPEWNSVDLVCHSMGGLVAREAYLHTEAGRHVRGIAYLASPHYGAPKAYFVLHPEIGLDFGGFFRELVGEIIWDYVVKLPGDPDDLEDALKGAAREFQSVYELLPDEFYFRGQYIVDVDPPFPRGDRMVRSAAATYCTDVCHLPRADHPNIRNALAFKRNLGASIPPFDDQHRLVVYSRSEETSDKVRFNDYDLDVLDNFDDPYGSGQRGDGTVPSYSARAAMHNAIRVPGDHSSVPNISPTFRALLRFLTR